MLHVTVWLLATIAIVGGAAPVPPHAIAILGQTVKSESHGFVILPGDNTIATRTGSDIRVATLEGKLVGEFPSGQADFQKGYRGLEDASSIFLSSDRKMFYWTTSAELLTQSLPFNSNNVPSITDLVIDPARIDDKSIYRVLPARNNELIGLTANGQLHRYHATTKKWTQSDSTPLAHIRWFAAGGSIVAFAARSILTPRTDPVEITLHDLDKGRDLKPMRFDQLYDFSLSRDGKTLAAISHTDFADHWHVQVWNLEEREKRVIRLKGPADRIFLSDDGSKFACVEQNDNYKVRDALRIPTIEFYDAERGKYLSSGRIAGDKLFYGQFTNDGKTFLAMGEAGVLRNWATATGKATAMGEGPQAPVTGVACLPGGGYSTVSHDGQCIHWSEEFKPVLRWECRPQMGRDHDVEIAPIALSPNKKTLYSQDPENLTRLVSWDLITGKKNPGFQYVFPENHRLFSLSVSSDSLSIAISMSKTRIGTEKSFGFELIDATNGQPRSLPLTKEGYSKIRLSNRHQIRFVGSDCILASGSREYECCNLKTGEEEFNVVDRQISYNQYQFAISPDGKQFAGALSKADSRPGARGADIGLRDAITSKLLRRLPLYPEAQIGIPFTCLAYSWDGKLIAVGLKNGNVLVYNTSGEGQPREFLGHSGAVRSMDFNNDGKTLITGSDDTTAIVWKLDQK